MRHDLGTPVGETPAQIDRVLIEELELYAKLGTTPEERAYPQRVLVSVSVGLNLEKAGKSKDIADTVCYSTLASSFKRLAEENEYVLVEELLEVLSSSVFTKYAAVEDLSLLLKKFAVPTTAWVGVQITRKRVQSSAKAKVGF